MKPLLKKTFIYLMIAVAGLSLAANAKPEIPQETIQQDETSRLEEFSIHAPQLRDSERKIQVYLPPNYFDSDKNYPVIYLQDGYYLFNPEWIRDCHYDETLDQLYFLGQLEGVIAVDIFASSTNRWDEYSPWINESMHLWNESWSKGGGEGDAYLDFIIDTLKPYIDSHYRTLPDRDNTGIGGFSMGGLISLYAGLSRPEVFSKVMAVSPAVWFAEVSEPWLSDNQLLNYIKNNKVPENVAFYLDIGTTEWADNLRPVKDETGNQITFSFAWLDGAQAAFNTLKEAGVPANNLLLVIEEGGVHDTPSWGRRFGDAIRWLYVDRSIHDNQPIVWLDALSAEEIVSQLEEEIQDSVEPTIAVNENTVANKKLVNQAGEDRNTTFLPILITSMIMIAGFITFKYLANKKS